MSLWPLHILHVLTTECLNVEFAFQYGIWEFLRHEKIAETHVLATLLTGYGWLFNGKKDPLHIRYH